MVNLNLEPTLGRFCYYDDGVSFGEYVRELMSRRGINPAVLAKSLRKSAGNVRNILDGRVVNGSVTKPPLNEMDAWADALNCTPEERDHLRYLAERTHCPPGLLAKLDAYEAEVAVLHQQVAEITKVAQAKGIISTEVP